MPGIVDDAERLLDELKAVEDRAPDEFSRLEGMDKLKAAPTLASNA